MLMRFRVIFVESQKWEMMIVNNDAFFASVIDLLREGKRVTIPVKGTSMLPFIVAERDLVVLEAIEAVSSRQRSIAHGTRSSPGWSLS